MFDQVGNTEPNDEIKKRAFQKTGRSHVNSPSFSNFQKDWKEYVCEQWTFWKTPSWIPSKAELQDQVNSNSFRPENNFD